MAHFGTISVQCVRMRPEVSQWYPVCHPTYSSLVISPTVVYRHPHIVAYVSESPSVFVPATDEDNRMVVETFGNYFKILASEVQ